MFLSPCLFQVQELAEAVLAVTPREVRESPQFAGQGIQGSEGGEPEACMAASQWDYDRLESRIASARQEEEAIR